MIAYACNHCARPLLSVAYTVDGRDFCNVGCYSMRHGREEAARAAAAEPTVETQEHEQLAFGVRPSHG